jgi:hypothetical protein
VFYLIIAYIGLQCASQLLTLTNAAYFKYFHKSVRYDDTLGRRALEYYPLNYSYVSMNLQNIYNFALLAIYLDPMLLDSIPVSVATQLIYEISKEEGRFFHRGRELKLSEHFLKKYAKIMKTKDQISYCQRPPYQNDSLQMIRFELQRTSSSDYFDTYCIDDIYDDIEMTFDFCAEKYNFVKKRVIYFRNPSCFEQKESIHEEVGRFLMDYDESRILLYPNNSPISWEITKLPRKTQNFDKIEQLYVSDAILKLMGIVKSGEKNHFSAHFHYIHLENLFLSWT